MRCLPFASLAAALIALSGCVAYPVDHYPGHQDRDERYRGPDHDQDRGWDHRGDRRDDDRDRDRDRDRNHDRTYCDPRFSDCGYH